MNEETNFPSWVRGDASEKWRPFSGGHTSETEGLDYLQKHLAPHLQFCVLPADVSPNFVEMVHEHAGNELLPSLSELRLMEEEGR